MRKLVLVGLSAVISLAAVASACSASGEGDDGFSTDDASGGSSSSGNGEGGAGAGNTTLGQGGFDPSGSGGSGAGAANCDHQDPTVDFDQDGFFPPQDCNDCDANSNPGAVEVVVTEPDDTGVVPPPADEDCDGTKDNPLPTCDDGLALTDTDPVNGARAIDLCKEATGDSWGVMSASYVRSNGAPASVYTGIGLFDGFGPNVAVQKGTRMLGISSGFARRPGDPGACTAQGCSHTGFGTPPAGYPQAVPNCQVSQVVNDDIAMQVQLRAPTNATGYKFRFKFYSFEYAEYVCTQFNDQFVALVDPAPVGANNGNISFDSANNPVSVNIAFFDVCDPNKTDFASVCIGGGWPTCPPQPNPYCPSGTADLEGNGFLDAFGSGEDGGATSWLETTAPITGGDEFSIRFAIWDVADTSWDSTTLVDSFEWIASGGVDVGTGEVPDPK